MEKRSSFLKDNFILIAIAVIVSYGVWKRFHSTPKKEISFKAERSERALDLKQSVEIINPKKRTETISQQRQMLAARLAINSRVFTPTVVGQNLQMTFRLDPRPRACKDGDIDLIRKATGEKGKLLVTLEDDNQTVVSHRKLNVSELKAPYLFPISIKESGRTQIYKMSLCSDAGETSCNGLEAFDYETSSKKMGQDAEFKNVKAGQVFYSYSFGVIKNEVQLFDGTNPSSRQSYAKFLQAAGGNERQLNFIDSTVAQQKKLGILPLTVEKQNIVLPLYFNDKSKCTLSMNGRRP